MLFLDEKERAQKIRSKFEELRKRRITKDWEQLPELIEDWNNHECTDTEKEFEDFLSLPYRFYRDDYNEWMKGYNATPKIENSHDVTQPK